MELLFFLLVVLSLRRSHVGSEVCACRLTFQQSGLSPCVSRIAASVFHVIITAPRLLRRLSSWKRCVWPVIGRSPPHDVAVRCSGIHRDRVNPATAPMFPCGEADRPCGPLAAQRRGRAALSRCRLIPNNCGAARARIQGVWWRFGVCPSTDLCLYASRPGGASDRTTMSN